MPLPIPRARNARPYGWCAVIGFARSGGLPRPPFRFMRNPNLARAIRESPLRYASPLGYAYRRGRRPRRPAGERSLPLRSLRITVGLCKNPTVLGRARKVSPAGSVALLHTSVCRGLHRRPAPRPYEVGASPLGCADFCGRMMASAPTESASPLGCVNFVGAPRSSPPTGLCAPTVAVLFLPVFLD